MTPTFDVPGRLAQGRPAVETMSEYVWAAHQVGFSDPDLTLHPGQMRDWYGAEDGMDLAVLQRDCVAIDAAVRATREALAIQEAQGGVLSRAWQGSGAQAARQFLHRHGVASAAVADALVTASAALQRTLEQLWRTVDAKVEATVAIESEVGAARQQWRAAAATVTTGAGDRAVAAELVDTAVKPFVQSRIATEWVTAMQAAGADVAEAYRTAAAEVRGGPRVVFDIPGELGPSAPAAPSPAIASAPVPASAAVPAAAAVPAPTAPAAWTAPPSAAAPPGPPPAAPPPAPAPLPEAAVPLAPPAAAPMSDLGGGGAMPAVGQRFADALSGLLGGGIGDGAAGDAVDPLDDLEPPEPADEDDEPEDEDPDEEDPDEEEPEDNDPDGDEPVAEEAVAEPVSAEPEPEALPPPEPTPPPPPAEPLPPPPTEERTPCEIAADEVPQVGPPPSEPGGG